MRSRLGQTEAPSSSGHALSQVCSSLDRASLILEPFYAGSSTLFVWMRRENYWGKIVILRRTTVSYAKWKLPVDVACFYRSERKINVIPLLHN